jgi:hypothetical protein
MGGGDGFGADGRNPLQCAEPAGAGAAVSLPGNRLCDHRTGPHPLPAGAGH